MAAPSQFASASLYVGDLLGDVTEANLFEVFNAIGPVTSIRVCRDAITRRSLGYAYVNYANAADAERAIDQLNNSLIKNKPCRVMWSQRDPATRKSGSGNIFIKNLDASIDHKALNDTFAQFGQILSCKIELDSEQKSKGYGYIQFATKEAADKAIAKVNGMMLNDKKVFVGPFVSRRERIAAGGAKQFTNIYVNNLVASIDDAKLTELFSPFGVIKSSIVMKDNEGKSKGFGFVNFDKPEEAQKAVDGLNGREVEGQAIYVGRAQKKAEREEELRSKFEALKNEQLSKFQGSNLYVKNLDDDMDDKKLRTLFEQFGTITSAKVMSDNKGSSKGFAFVCFATPEEATKALTEMNGKIIGNKPLYVGLAQRKDMRRAALEAQFANRTKMMPPPMRGMYPPGAQPMFYPPGAQPFGMPYPAAPFGRGRGFPAAFPPNMPGAPAPNFMIMPGARGGRGAARGGASAGRGAGPRPGRGSPMDGVGPVPVPMVGAMPIPVQPPQPAPAMSPAVPLTAQTLNSYPPEEQKRLLGERLYPLIAKVQPSRAGKITGMILDSSFNEEMLHLIENTDALNEKIEEAMKVLEEHSKKTGEQL